MLGFGGRRLARFDEHGGAPLLSTKVTMNNVVYGLSRAMTWFGAAVLTLLAVISVVSIGGRALSFTGLGPVPGDFELVEAGTALAVFCFLPWCHLRRGHATVELFWHAFPAPLRRLLAVLTDALMLAVWTLLVWRMGVSMLGYRDNAETTFILQMPVWWGYAASMVPALVGLLAYAWRLIETLGLATPPERYATSQAVH
jgi:TRAP-type C4-dicarboxylate transport system permease small subunit